MVGNTTLVSLQLSNILGSVILSPALPSSFSSLKLSSIFFARSSARFLQFSTGSVTVSKSIFSNLLSKPFFTSERSFCEFSYFYYQRVAEIDESAHTVLFKDVLFDRLDNGAIKLIDPLFEQTLIVKNVAFKSSSSFGHNIIDFCGRDASISETTFHDIRLTSCSTLSLYTRLNMTVLINYTALSSVEETDGRSAVFKVAKAYTPVTFCNFSRISAPGVDDALSFIKCSGLSIKTCLFRNCTTGQFIYSFIYKGMTFIYRTQFVGVSTNNTCLVYFTKRMMASNCLFLMDDESLVFGSEFRDSECVVVDSFFDERLETQLTILPYIKASNYTYIKRGSMTGVVPIVSRPISQNVLTGNFTQFTN